MIMGLTAFNKLAPKRHNIPHASTVLWRPVYDNNFFSGAMMDEGHSLYGIYEDLLSVFAASLLALIGKSELRARIRSKLHPAYSVLAVCPVPFICFITVAKIKFMSPHCNRLLDAESNQRRSR